jgi:hypothetical protein
LCIRLSSHDIFYYPKRQFTMPINSREKGASAERELASKLRSLFGVMARRGQQFSGGHDSPDVVFSDKIHIESKRTERLNLSQAYAQSKRDSKYPDSGRIPCVMSRRSREDWLVTVCLDDIIEFSKAILDEFKKGQNELSKASISNPSSLDNV